MPIFHAKALIQTISHKIAEHKPIVEDFTTLILVTIKTKILKNGKHHLSIFRDHKKK